METRPEHGEGQEEDEERPANPDYQSCEDDAQDILGPSERPHENLLEHPVLSVEPELSPSVCACVDHRQCDGPGGEVELVGHYPPIPDIEWRDYSAEPGPLNEDEEQREEELKEERQFVQVRPEVPVNEPRIDVHELSGLLMSSTVTRLMKASSRVVSAI